MLLSLLKKKSGILKIKGKCSESKQAIAEAEL